LAIQDGREELYPSLRKEILECQKCRLCERRLKVVPGEGDLYSSLLFVGEGPGQREDQQGRPFIGPAGNLLESLIQSSLGLKREQVYITNIVKCRPPENRDPLPDEVEACHPYLIAQIGLIAPDLVCILGRHSLHTLLNPEWSITAVHGKTFRKDGILFFPTFHPAAALRSQQVKEELSKDFQTLRLLVKKETRLGD